MKVRGGGGVVYEDKEQQWTQKLNSLVIKT